MSDVPGPVATPRLPRRRLALVAGVAAGSALVTVARILVLRDVFDAVRGLEHAHADLVRVGWSIAALLVIALLAGFLRSREWALSDRIGIEYADAWRTLAYERLHSTPLPELAGSAHGAALLRFTGELGPLRNWAAYGAAQGLAALVLVAAALTTLAFLDVWIAATLAVVGLLAALATPRLARDVGPRAAHVRRLRSRMTTRVADHLAHAGVIRLFGRARGEIARVRRAGLELTQAAISAASGRARSRGVAEALAGLSAAAVAAAGAYEVAAGRTTHGVMIAAVLVTRQLGSPLRRLVQFHDHRTRARQTRARLESFLARATLPPPQPEGPLSHGPARLRVRGLHVAGRLADVTFTAPAGAHVALVGPNGSGRTALLLAIAGVLAPDAGHVRIDDARPDRSSRARRRVAYVGPAAPLLRGSLGRNLRYRNRRASDEELAALVRALDLEALVARLPEGLDTELGHEARELSLGERRRVELLRALVGRPDVLLVDDVCAGLDAATRDVVLRALAAYDGTLVHAVTDRADARRADVVWRLPSGGRAERTRRRDRDGATA